MVSGRPKLIAVNPSLLNPATAILAIFATVRDKQPGNRSRNSKDSCSTTPEPIMEEGFIDELEATS